MVRQKTSSTETAISEDKTTSQKTAKKPTSTAKTATVKSKPAIKAKTTTKTTVSKTKAAMVKAKPTAAADANTVKESAQLPMTENYDVIKQVADIKAKNEKKKTRKVAGSTAKTTVLSSPTDDEVYEKGKKATSNNKHTEVLENAKIAEAKKFMEMKENPDSSESVCCGNACGKGGAFCSWIRAYKNIFNFKGRTSRFEFWSFMLINLFVTSLFIYGVRELLEPDFPKVAKIVFWIFYIPEVVIHLSICTRRLHDGGYTAWKGFFRPLIISGLPFLMLLFVLFSGIANQHLRDWLEWLIGFALLFGLIYLYYCIKIFVVAGFYEEENGTNEYGAMPAYCNKAYKQRGLRYSILYMLLVIVSNVVLAIISIGNMIGFYL